MSSVKFKYRSRKERKISYAKGAKGNITLCSCTEKFADFANYSLRALREINTVHVKGAKLVTQGRKRKYS